MLSRLIPHPAQVIRLPRGLESSESSNQRYSADSPPDLANREDIMVRSSRSLAPLLVAALCSSTSGQSPFSEAAEVTDTLSGWADLTVADMNGDGLGDLIVAPGYGPGVKVLLSKGGGQFERSYRAAEDVGIVQHVETTDWNGDGLPDLLLSVESTLGTNVWAAISSTSSQHLDAESLLNGVGPVLTMEAADVNGDGADDLVLATSGASAHLGWYERLPTGLSSTLNIIVAEEVSTSAPADLDGDGFLDVYYQLPQAQDPHFLQGIGGGSFGLLFRPIPSPPPSRHYSIGDIDGDGLVDVIDADGASVRIHYGTGSFHFAAGVTVGTPVLSNVQDARTVDVDGDGDLDLYLSSRQPGQPAQGSLLENANGAFLHTQAVFPGLWVLHSFHDVTGDGHPDALGGGIQIVQVCVNATPGQPSRFLHPANVAVPYGNPNLIGAIDIDGDGVTDVLGSNNNRFEWFPGFGDLTFGAPKPLFEFPPLTTFYGAFCADLNGDDRPDIVTLSSGFSSQSLIEIHDNLGSGQFAAPRQVNPGPAYVRAYPVDVDGDGDLDLLGSATGGAPAPLRLNLNDGAGNFVPATALGDTPSWADSLVGADFDQDGFIDIAITSGAQALWAKGIGPAQFGPWLPLDQFGHPTDLGARDMDGDGWLDLHARRIGRPVWFRQSSPGVFDAAASLLAPSTTMTPRVQLIEDFDSDGVADMLISQDSYSIFPSFYKGIGQPAFAAPVRASAFERGNGEFQLADADADGDLELFYRSYYPPRIGLLINDTIPSTGETSCGPAVENSRGLAAHLSASGSAVASGPSFTLRATKLPLNRFGFFLGSRTAQLPTSVPNSQGRLCLGGSIGRYIGPGQVVSSGATGSFQITVNPTRLVNGTGVSAAIQGETWYFQGWVRDVDSQGGATSNFTDALAIEFH